MMCSEVHSMPALEVARLEGRYGDDLCAEILEGVPQPVEVLSRGYDCEVDIPAKLRSAVNMPRLPCVKTSRRRRTIEMFVARPRSGSVDNVKLALGTQNSIFKLVSMSL